MEEGHCGIRHQFRRGPDLDSFIAVVNCVFRGKACVLKSWRSIILNPTPPSCHAGAEESSFFYSMHEMPCKQKSSFRDRFPGRFPVESAAGFGGMRKGVRVKVFWQTEGIVRPVGFIPSRAATACRRRRGDQPVVDRGLVAMFSRWSRAGDARRSEKEKGKP